MNRKEFLQTTCSMGICSCVFSVPGNLVEAQEIDSEELDRLIYERQFVENWLTDLMNAMEEHVDRETREKMVAYCGRSCFERHQFKQQIAADGRNDLEKLLKAYDRNYDVSHEGNVVDITYRGSSNGCKCPAAKNRPPKPDDIHCECTRATQQAIFEAAFDRPFRVEIVESVRRGGSVCHMRVHLT